MFFSYQKTDFQPIFCLKYLGNTIEILLNQFTTTKKHKKTTLKLKNPPETKNIYSWAHIWFLGVFKVKKTYTRNLNFPRHMKPFDTKNNRFGGQIPHH